VARKKEKKEGEERRRRKKGERKGSPLSPSLAHLTSTGKDLSFTPFNFHTWSKN
jgi:hypothetical protein